MSDVIEPKDARVPVASNEFVVVDVRAEEEWVEGAERVPGSIHIPAEEIDSRLDELPDDRPILVVCADGELSSEIAERIDGKGREAQFLEGGVSAWKSDKLLTQPSPDAEPPKAEDEPPVEEPDEKEDETGDEEEDER